MENDVKFIRLRNGDDIIAEVVEHYESSGSSTGESGEEFHYFMFINPLKIIYIPNLNEGGWNLALHHWITPLLTDEKAFMVGIDEVVTMSDASEFISKNYLASIESYNEKEEEIKANLNQEEPENYDNLEDFFPEDLKKKLVDNISVSGYKKELLDFFMNHSNEKKTKGH